MQGDGSRSDEPVASSDGFDLSATLAGLDAQEVERRREALRTVRTTLEERPERCAPTVPKLRGLLEDPDADCDGLVLECLAELAAVTPADVVPTVDAVLEHACERPDAETTAALRCLSHVAEARPRRTVEAVRERLDADPTAGDADQVEALLAVLRHRSDAFDEAPTERLEELSAADPAVREHAELALAVFGRPEA